MVNAVCRSELITGVGCCNEVAGCPFYLHIPWGGKPLLQSVKVASGVLIPIQLTGLPRPTVSFAVRLSCLGLETQDCSRACSSWLSRLATF
jgi:hypothetical protein